MGHKGWGIIKELGSSESLKDLTVYPEVQPIFNLKSSAIMDEKVGSIKFVLLGWLGII